MADQIDDDTSDLQNEFEFTDLSDDNDVGVIVFEEEDSFLDMLPPRSVLFFFLAGWLAYQGVEAPQEAAEAILQDGEGLIGQASALWGEGLELVAAGAALLAGVGERLFGVNEIRIGSLEIPWGLGKPGSWTWGSILGRGA